MKLIKKTPFFPRNGILGAKLEMTLMSMYNQMEKTYAYIHHGVTENEYKRCSSTHHQDRKEKRVSYPELAIHSLFTRHVPKLSFSSSSLSSTSSAICVAISLLLNPRLLTVGVAVECS